MYFKAKDMKFPYIELGVSHLFLLNTNIHGDFKYRLNINNFINAFA